VHNHKPALCNDIIIVFEITPLHSVSIITNFITAKCNKQKKNKKTKLEINMHQRGNAIPAGPSSDFDENLFH